MMHKEFEAIAGYEVSYEDFINIIEPMYMATNLSKQEFVKTLNKKFFTDRMPKPETKLVPWKRTGAGLPHSNHTEQTSHVIHMK